MMDMRPRIIALISAGRGDAYIADELDVDIGLVRWVRRWMESG